MKILQFAYNWEPIGIFQNIHIKTISTEKTCLHVYWITRKSTYRCARLTCITWLTCLTCISIITCIICITCITCITWITCITCITGITGITGNPKNINDSLTHWVTTWNQEMLAHLKSFLWRSIGATYLGWLEAAPLPRLLNLTDPNMWNNFVPPPATI